MAALLLALVLNLSDGGVSPCGPTWCSALDQLAFMQRTDGTLVWIRSGECVDLASVEWMHVPSYTVDAGLTLTQRVHEELATLEVPRADFWEWLWARLTSSTLAQVMMMLLMMVCLAVLWQVAIEGGFYPMAVLGKLQGRRAAYYRWRARVEAERHERAVLAAALHRSNAFDCGCDSLWCRGRRNLRAQLFGDVR